MPKYLNNIDFNKNQALNMVLQNLGSEPGTPVEGLIFYDTANHVTKIYAHAAWETVSVVGHTHTDLVAKSLFDAQSILAAVTDDTPVAVVISEQQVVGRITGGNIKGLSAAEIRTLINVADGANNYVHPTTNGNIHIPASGAAAQILQYDSAGTAKWVSVSGDIAIADGGALTIGNTKVTYAKIQNVSATDKLLGRSTAGAGSIEEIACTAAGRALLDDATAADQLTTLGAAAAAHNHDSVYIAKAVGTAHGDLLYFSASGTPAVLAHGTDAQVLTAHTDGTITWESPSAGHTQNTDTGTTGATFEIDSDATGVVLKNNSGVLELRNHADNAYMDLKVKDLTVLGTTFTVESETVTFHDNILLLDENAATAAATAGLQVERGSTGADASLLWLESGGFWEAGIAGSEKQIARKYATLVGDGAAETIDVVHNLNSRDVCVDVYEAATPYNKVFCDVQKKDANTVTLVFAVHPASNEYRCVVVG